MHVFILTGAGISAESGLPTFRGDESSAIWTNFNPEDVATPAALILNRKQVYSFFNECRRRVEGARPNAAHCALVRLHQELTKSCCNLTIVTQNIDDLHEKSGLDNVIHMHGALDKVRCMACNGVFQWTRDLGPDYQCRDCLRKNCIRPNVVLFGEEPQQLDEIRSQLHLCDIFLSIGTSNAVYPASRFVDIARARGVHTCELNLFQSDSAERFAERRYGPASKIVPAWVEQFVETLAEDGKFP